MRSGCNSAALTPKLTIVRRDVSGDPSAPGNGPDAYLPTVMTCANYIKLPNYSTTDALRTQLLKAMAEGQGSFHLS